jgi:hypothetical protein
MEQGRDALFQEFFGREPTKEELQRFNRIEGLMGVPRDDSLWYYVLVNEFYDDRLKNRLAEIDHVADSAANRALEKIAEAVGEKADSLAAQKNKGFMWRSWGLMMSFVVLLCAAVFNAGYVMGNGHSPFWLRSETGLRRVAGWILNVPSGWILLLGSGPFLLEVYCDSMKKITANKRFGVNEEENIVLYAKAIASLVAMVFIGLIVLYLTGMNVALAYN